MHSFFNSLFLSESWFFIHSVHIARASGRCTAYVPLLLLLTEKKKLERIVIAFVEFHIIVFVAIKALLCSCCYSWFFLSIVFTIKRKALFLFIMRMLVRRLNNFFLFFSFFLFILCFAFDFVHFSLSNFHVHVRWQILEFASLLKHSIYTKHSENHWDELF